jgi:CRP-like cAMP-binding protein
LKDCDSNEFVWATIQLAKERKFIQNEIIYQRGDVGDSFYMIYEGRVTLQAHNEQPIIQYDDGQLVGDSDALLELARDCKSYANYKVTVLYQIKMD